jgi:excisionase family DNA binding protein
VSVERAVVAAPSPEILSVPTRASLARKGHPLLRFDVTEAAQILRMSRAQLYNRIHAGSIQAQKDGGRTYITRSELERYVTACDQSNNQRADSKKSKSNEIVSTFRGKPEFFPRPGP